MNVDRYCFDQINSYKWSILDNENLELNYLMTLTKIKNNKLSNQCIIISNNRSELYSCYFYASDKYEARDLVDDMMDMIEDYNLDLDNLIELAAEYGGLVNRKPVILPSVTYNLNLH